jgi:hypothetical protein
MEFLAQLPIWLIYLIVVALILISAEAGFRIGLELRKRGMLQEKDSSIGPMVGSLMGLLAFFLAFAIGFALNNTLTRRSLVLSEANAIGTTYLRAGFLDESSRDQSQELLREYTQLRFSAYRAEDLAPFVARGEQIHNELWALAEAYANTNPQFIPAGLYIESLNEVIDLQTTRVVTNQALRVPLILFWLLGGIVIFTFILLGIASSADGRRNLLALTIFALAFAAAILLLIDLDNPTAGFIDVGLNAMEILQQSIGTPMP